MDNKKFWFFGSKLNTALLLILIILMVIALRWMYQDREKYLGIPGDNMTSKDAEYWDDLTIKNPKLNEILGYDGKPLSKFEIEGNKGDLVSFSIKPGQEVSGLTKFTGVLKGGYFFEGNFVLSVLDENKKPIANKYNISKHATSNWMTSGPVDFEGYIDFSNIPIGKVYIEITPDDPNDHSAGVEIKSRQILIPVIVK